VQIEAPLRNLHKEDIIRQFKDLPLELTLTCMAPHDGGVHCGRCNKCRERQLAFEKAGVPDRTRYAG
jgi:7-cyano-7-deazaguanine synthase